MVVTPALPPATGPNASKAKFFAEAAAVFEVMALFHQLTEEEQTEFRTYISGLAAEVARRAVTKT